MSNASPDFTVDGRTLVIGPAAAVKFPLPIGEVVECGDVLVVRLRVPAHITYNENVFGVARDGRTLWQIAPRKYVYDWSPYLQAACSGANVRLHNWDGTIVDVDAATGQVRHEEWHK